MSVPERVALAKPCLMIVLSHLTDAERFKRGYQDEVARLIRQSGGSFDLVAGDLKLLEGNFPEGGGALILRWPDRPAAEAFWNSSEYAEIKKLRDGTGTFQVVLVDALTP